MNCWNYLMVDYYEKNTGWNICEDFIKSIPMKGVHGIKKLRNNHIKSWCTFYKASIYFYLDYACYINVKKYLSKGEQ